MAADSKVLGGLHEQLTKVYLSLISPREVPIMAKGEPVLDEEGNVRTYTVMPSAAELAAANAFLKQNNITSSPTEDPGLEALKEQLANRRRTSVPVLPDFAGEDLH